MPDRPRNREKGATMLFERILIPLDGSPVSEAVLSQVERIVRRTDSELVLLRAAPKGVYPYADLPVTLEREVEEAKAYVQQIASRLSEQGARARGIVRDGSPAGAILDLAQQENITLIAMATHGRTGLSRWVFGSVAEKVLRASPVPLLLLRSFVADSARTSATPLAIRKILVPVERFRLDILPFVREFAQLFGSRIVLLHVVEPGEDAAARAEARREAESVGQRLQEDQIPTVILEREGPDPAQEILRACQDEGAGMIAITTHGRSGLTRWVLGSVAEKVLRSATVPLLIVRNPG